MTAMICSNCKQEVKKAKLDGKSFTCFPCLGEKTGRKAPAVLFIGKGFSKLRSI